MSAALEYTKARGNLRVKADVVELKPSATKGVEKPPGIFSMAFLRNLLGAWKVWKYTPREHAIYQYSTANTLFSVAIFKAITGFISVKFPWVVPIVASIWTSVKAAVAAVGAVLFSFINS